ncbi:hypothetical protein [Spiroplasma endosymbiont of Virgichneumon dumeticola]|uniref:hypothetical protein n=1 Tax=Spiroplasma endosymbiont of Virgichneumon dumeticola TaxID=3139323 RepID=UPI0035C8F8E3
MVLILIPNDILKVNTNHLDTLLTNKKFDWKNNDFGLANFDATTDPYKVTDWYYISANLKLDFTCLDENSKANTTTISQTYDMYFANQDSNLNQVVETISANVQKN